MNDYETFIKSKVSVFEDSGFEVENLNKNLFPFQKWVVSKALKKGKYAIFSDCGTGKSIMQLSWADAVKDFTNLPVLVLAPLAVSSQTIREGKKFGIKVSKLKSTLSFSGDYKHNVKGNSIYITNYEQLENVDCSLFSGVVIDESGILKNYSGAYKQLILKKFIDTPYKLACTAVPSPNDELELGNHAEFLNVCTSQDMRALYFTTDKELIKGDKYRLKKHAEKDFYKFISSWAIMFSSPADIGFNEEGYILPPLNFIEKKVVTDIREVSGQLFNSVAVSATNFNSELRLTKVERLSEVSTIVNASADQFIIWIKHNEEGEDLRRMIPGSIEVKGSDTIEYKEEMLLGFAENKFRVLITKSKIAQFGLNFQNCHNQVFASLDFSFEALYQSIRRSYRFGQKYIVNIYLITTDTMQNVIQAIEEKQEKFIKMQTEMRETILSNLKVNVESKERKVYEGNGYKLIQNDCIEEIKSIPENSIGYSFFSPPFAAMYVFSNDPRDMSNVRNYDEFLTHFSYLIPELLRVTKPGRIVSLHVMQSTTLLGKDGYYSIKDFRGDIIRLFQGKEAEDLYKAINRMHVRMIESIANNDKKRTAKIKKAIEGMEYELKEHKPTDGGFYFHEEHMIRKDPKTAAIRTKNRQLMWGTTKKDSTIVRPGLADYIISFRKPGENMEPVVNNIPFELWCEMAEPVWLQVEEGDTLEFRSAKENEDERHLTPTQLKPIKWCYEMYSNKGDTILCPYGGIGSESIVALENDRGIISIELKESYVNVHHRNILNTLEKNKQLAFGY